MYIKDLDTNEQYFMYLYDKWWHYLFLGLTWFVPHKAYLMKKKFNTNQETGSKYSGIKFGLLIGSGFFISDILQRLELYKVPEPYYWIWYLIVYPLIVLSTFISWQFILKITKNNRELDYDKVKIVKIRFFSLNAIIHCYWKLLISFVLILIIFESIKFDLIFIPIAVVIFNIFIFTFNLLAGFNTIIHSSDNRNFKVDDKRIEKQIQK